MVKFCPLFSSSKGNSMYLGTDKGGILIDAGKSCKQIELALSRIGVSPDSIEAIFVTHEHTDHVAGLRVFAGRYHTKVYATNGTLCALDDSGILTEKFDAFCHDGASVSVGAFCVQPFATSHDAAESCGYCVEAKDGSRVAIATDLGYVSDTVLDAISGAETVLLESNHDVRMLENNPQYPYSLKRRILGDTGHLSNEVCAKTVQSLLNSGTKRFFLGHLSEQNNMPSLAYGATEAALTALGATVQEDCTLCVAKPVWDKEAFSL